MIAESLAGRSPNIFEYGRFLMIGDLVNNAVREGARQAVATTNTKDTAAIQNAVVYYLVSQQVMNSSGTPLTASDVQVYQATRRPAHRPRPTASGTTRRLGPAS